jgi:hypothetical protein
MYFKSKISKKAMRAAILSRAEAMDGWHVCINHRGRIHLSRRVCELLVGKTFYGKSIKNVFDVLDIASCVLPPFEVGQQELLLPNAPIVIAVIDGDYFVDTEEFFPF